MLDDNFSYNKIYLLSCISKVKKKKKNPYFLNRNDQFMYQSA